MNVLKIVGALICAYALFVSVSYLLFKILFPKIEVNDIDAPAPVVRGSRKERRPARYSRRQKNLAY